jgi:hypothetical protein
MNKQLESREIVGMLNERQTAAAFGKHPVPNVAAAYKEVYETWLPPRRKRLLRKLPSSL